MEVQNVEFVIGHMVYQAFDVRDRKEMTRDIEHHAAPGEVRSVLNADTVNLPRPRLWGMCFDSRRQELPDGLDAPKQSNRMRSAQDDSFRFNNQFIAFFPKVRSCSVRRQENPVAGGGFRGQYRKFESGGRPEAIREELSNQANLL